MSKQALQAELNELRRQSQAESELRVQLEQTVDSLRADKAGLEHQVDVLTRMLIGPKSERHVSDPESESSNQRLLFAAELAELAERVAEETGAQPSLSAEPGKPAKSRGRRKKFPEHLPEVRSTFELPEDQRQCCGQPMPEMGEATTRELERVEVSVVHVITRKKYCCRVCEVNVLTAPGPPRVIDKGMLGAGFLGYLIAERFGNHQPYNRLEKKFASEGLDLSRVVLCQSALRCAELLEPIYDQVAAEVVQSDIIQTDDTTVNLQKASRGGPRIARVWTYLDLEGRHLYDFTESRERDGPIQVLGEYRGYLQADAYSGYDVFFGPEGAKEVGCWAHCRRYFERALDSESELAKEALHRIGELYAIEREATSVGLSSGGRYELRQKLAAPRLKTLKDWLDIIEPTVLPKSPMGKAVGYALRQWDAFTRYIDDGRLNIDNNPAERALRAVAVGRKNWMIVGNPRGGRAAAIHYTLVMTCKAIGVDPRTYLRDVLLRIGTCSDVTRLTPHGWREHFEPEVRARGERILRALVNGGIVNERSATATA